MWAGKALEDVPGNGVALLLPLPLPFFCSACGAAVGGERASVTPGTEIKYTDPVGSVPP